VSMRERLREKFIQYCSAHGQCLEEESRYDEALALYRRGIEADQLVESFYQGLMRCFEQLDRRAEAISIYRRLRQILSATLGITPSPASETLARRMLEQH